MRKLRASSVELSSTLFSCSIRTMHNIINIALKQLLGSESYLPGINTSIYPKKHHDNSFDKKQVNELYDWTEKHPRVIQYPNLS